MCIFHESKKRVYEKESLAISKPSPAKGRFLDRVINQSTAPPYEKVNKINFSCISQNEIYQILNTDVTTQSINFFLNLTRDNLVQIQLLHKSTCAKMCITILMHNPRKSIRPIELIELIVRRARLYIADFQLGRKVSAYYIIEDPKLVLPKRISAFPFLNTSQQ